ncbi:MAG TPA: ABC transporter substrate-binding protein [Candidatus Binatia bacterium]|nr:ABC transporter substrate-binding protein [Candidatus Binatia bacterium]
MQTSAASRVKTMRLLPCLFLFALGPFLRVGEISAQTPLQKVTVSYSSSGITSIDYFIAKEKKFFHEEGLELLLVQMSANTAIAAGVTGDLTGLGSIGSAIRAIQRGAPLRVVSVSLRRPIFWLVTRPEYRSVKDLKGKVLATATIGGSQHTAAKKLITLGGLDPDKDITTIAGGEESRHLQGLVANSAQVAAISPPWVFLARDKFKLNVLDSAIDKYASIQNGLAVSLKTLEERPELVKKILRAKSKAARFFDQNEGETAELLAKIWKSDLAIAQESYRATKPAFTATGVPTDEEIKEYLALDAQILKLPEPVPPANVFDFSLQRQVNRELGIK